MKVCIFGAGAVGGHMAVRLSEGGADVSVVMRGANLDAVRRNGLELRAEGQKTLRAHPACTDNPDTLGIQDVVVLSVKHRALPEAFRGISPLVGPDTQIVTAMNGLPWWFAHGMTGLDDPALDALLRKGGRYESIPFKRWNACVVTSGNVVTEPGIIKNTTPGRNKLRIGNATGPIAAPVAAFADYAKAGGYDAETVTDIRHHIWSKFYINVGLSALATICEQTIAEICQAPATRAISLALIAEVGALGRAIGIDTQVDAGALTDPKTAPPHFTSFLQDLKKRQPLEIDNGIIALSRISALTSVDTPSLDTVAAVIAARSAGSVLD